jgi:hypothetical protein
MLDYNKDSNFIESLTFPNLKEEYIRERNNLIMSISEKYEKNKDLLSEKKNLGIELDRAHRMILNACIFPFAQKDSIDKYGYYFLRGSPLRELDVDNVDFLLVQPTFNRVILGEVKGNVADYGDVIDEMKERIGTIESNTQYLEKNYLQQTISEKEYVIGVGLGDGDRMMKTVLRKGGKIKVWSTGIDPVSFKQILMLMVPPNEKNSPENSMIHSDLVFSKAMRRVETTSNFKSIFPESHTFAKLSLLTQIRERQDGTFSFTDFQNLVGEELDYLEQNEVNSITKRILKICEEIKIVEKMDTNNTSESFYKIISRGKKADTREAEIKKKWINFAIRKDMEQEIDDKIQGLQKTFSIKRSKTKGIDEY